MPSPERPQRHAAGRLGAAGRQEQAARRRRVGTRKLRHLPREALEGELDPERGLVLLEKHARGRDLIDGRRADDLEAHVSPSRQIKRARRRG